MKIFRWIVMIRNDVAGFYHPVTFFKFLAGNVPNGDFVEPRWSDEPVLYQSRFARVQASELQRVGYNVIAFPWIFYAVASWIKARKKRKWK